MNIKKIFFTAAITAIVIAATTMSTFPSVAVLATPLLGQGGNNTATTTATNMTAMPLGGQENIIHIIKSGTNSYVISGGMSSVGTFDTTYRIAGERDAIKSAENLIISTISDDFNSSATIGYIMVGNMTTGAGGVTTLPNPFASPEQISEEITNKLSTVISEVENNTVAGEHVEIKCGFGMTLEDMNCHYIPLPM
ncbi:MAG TPA: hypothetical protein VGE82_01750 [Nitrososphaera sp.]